MIHHTVIIFNVELFQPFIKLVHKFYLSSLQVNNNLLSLFRIAYIKIDQVVHTSIFKFQTIKYSSKTHIDNLKSKLYIQI